MDFANLSVFLIISTLFLHVHEHLIHCFLPILDQVFKNRYI